MWVATQVEYRWIIYFYYVNKLCYLRLGSLAAAVYFQYGWLNSFNLQPTADMHHDSESSKKETVNFFCFGEFPAKILGAIILSPWILSIDS